MASLLISTQDIKQHGMMQSVIIEIIKSQKIRHSAQIAELLGESKRAIEYQLVAMQKAGLIELVVNPNGRKLAFIL